MYLEGVRGLVESARPHCFLVFFLRQPPPRPAPVRLTGGGVEWDRRAASTNLFPFAAWLMSPAGVRLLPTIGMYPPRLSEDSLLLESTVLRVIGGFCSPA